MIDQKPDFREIRTLVFTIIVALIVGLHVTSESPSQSGSSNLSAQNNTARPVTIRQAGFGLTGNFR